MCEAFCREFGWLFGDFGLLELVLTAVIVLIIFHGDILRWVRGKQ
jgi:hypothetical protein